VLSGGAQRFTAFGQRANSANDAPLTGSSLYNFSDTLTHHGFTGHEELDESGLIHMNGRVYSPLTTRFISPDPFVQDPSDLQSLNRYSYVLNNPLVHTDPSGYWNRKDQGYLRLAVAIAVTVASSGAAASAVGATEGTSFATAFAAASSAQQASAMMILISSGYTAGFIESGNLKGAVLGALDAGVSFGIGSEFPEPGSFANVAGHATAGGVMSVLQGGKFGHGFVSAGLSAAINPHIDLGSKFANGIAASIVGGTISKVTGGKFANGALSTAFEYSFNALFHLPDSAQCFSPESCAYLQQNRIALDQGLPGITNAAAGVADGFTMVGSYGVEAATGAGIDRNSDVYKFGLAPGTAISGGRLGYALAVKITAGYGLIIGGMDGFVFASNMRNWLKFAFRLGMDDEFRMYSNAEVLAKKGGNIRAATISAGKSNEILDSAAALSGATNSSRIESDKR